MGTLALIGLGSNLGDRKAHLDAAIAALAETPGVTVRAVSSYHETEPVGGPPGQGPFLNAAAAIETTLDPTALLRRPAGRSRPAPGASERSAGASGRSTSTCLLFGDLILDSAELTIPHPRMAVRRFVLAPLAEIAPGAVDPRTGRTVADLLAGLDP